VLLLNINGVLLNGFFIEKLEWALLVSVKLTLCFYLERLRVLFLGIQKASPSPSKGGGYVKIKKKIVAKKRGDVRRLRRRLVRKRERNFSESLECTRYQILILFFGVFTRNLLNI
jgi:hypothetical protein